MLKNRLKLKAAQELGKDAQRNIKGGGIILDDDIYCVEFCSSNADCLMQDEICVPYDCGSRFHIGHRCQVDPRV